MKRAVEGYKSRQGFVLLVEAAASISACLRLARLARKEVGEGSYDRVGIVRSRKV
jgi:hypothetical protein